MCLSHISSSSLPTGAPAPLRSFLDAGYNGVTLFFILSGFVLAFNYGDRLGEHLTLRGIWSFAVGLSDFELAVYDPRLTMAKSGLSPQTVGADTVVLGRPRCRQLIDRSVRAMVAVNVRAGLLHHVYGDSRIDVYGADQSLVRPTPADINAQPAGALSDNC